MQKLIDANGKEYAIGSRVMTAGFGWNLWARDRIGTVSKIESYKWNGENVQMVTITLDQTAHVLEYKHDRLTGQANEFTRIGT